MFFFRPHLFHLIIIFVNQHLLCFQHSHLHKHQHHQLVNSDKNKILIYFIFFSPFTLFSFFNVNRIILYYCNNAGFMRIKRQQDGETKYDIFISIVIEIGYMRLIGKIKEYIEFKITLVLFK